MGQTVQVKEVGDEWIAKLASAEIVEGNFGEQAKFTDENGDVLYMPLTSAENQLKRLEGATIESIQEAIESGGVVWLKFYREPNTTRGGKPYWAISRVGQRTATKAPPATRTPPATDRASQSPPAATAAKAEPAKLTVPIFEAYKLILAAVLDEVAPMLEAYGNEREIPVTMADILSATATLMIRTEKEPTRPVFAAKARSQARRHAPDPQGPTQEYEERPFDEDEGAPFSDR